MLKTFKTEEVIIEITNNINYRLADKCKEYTAISVRPGRWEKVEWLQEPRLQGKESRQVRVRATAKRPNKDTGTSTRAENYD
jgi:hypothetical protein